MLAIAPANRSRSSFQPARDCTSPHAHDCSRGAGDARSASSASQRSWSVVTQTLTLCRECDLQVTDVVDAADDRAAPASFDQRDRCVLDLEWKQAVRGPADDSVQRRLDHATMRHDENIAVWMAAKHIVERCGDARVKHRGALPARHDVPIRLLDPACPRPGETLGDLFSTQAFPVAEEDLAQR